MVDGHRGGNWVKVDRVGSKLDSACNIPLILAIPLGTILPVTVVIAVRNEAANIRRCLETLGRMERIVVVDSRSTDATSAIAIEAGAEVVQFDYTGGYPKKRQWALNEIKISTPWVLLLDADEAIPPTLISEIEQVTGDSDSADAFFIKKGFHFLGKRMRFGGFSHCAILLFRSGKARFEHLIDEDTSSMDMEIHERLLVNGRVARLQTPLIHDDFKGLEAYVDRHNKYSTWEARVRYQFLTTGRWGEQSIKPRLLGDAQQRRRFLKHIAMHMPLEPWLWFIYHYFLRGGFLEGRRGLIASQIRANYIAMVRAKIFELREAARREQT